MIIPCATDKKSLLAAAWAAANLHASAMDSNSKHSITGLNAELIMGTLTPQQSERLLAYWTWWKAVWKHYEEVINAIEAGNVSTYNPEVAGNCPWDIWELTE